jgi:hypothetical protein
MVIGMLRKRVGGGRKRAGGLRKKRMGGMRKRVSKRNPNNIGGPNTCKVIETIPSQVVNLNTPYIFIKSGITGARATAIAKEFGLYRIARIIYTHRPLFDTYSSSLPGIGNSPNAVPTLYWKMNRYGDVPAAFTGDYMRSLGSKPFRLDDKNVKFSYKPNTLQVQQDAAGNTPASIKITPWLSTDDTPQDNLFTLSTAEHYGHSLFVEGGGAGTAQGTACYLDIQVVYEFKNPRLVSSTQDAPTAVTLKV